MLPGLLKQAVVNNCPIGQFLNDAIISLRVQKACPHHQTVRNWLRTTVSLRPIRLSVSTTRLQGGTRHPVQPKAQHPGPNALASIVNHDQHEPLSTLEGEGKIQLPRRIWDQYSTLSLFWSHISKARMASSGSSSSIFSFRSDGSRDNSS